MVYEKIILKEADIYARTDSHFKYNDRYYGFLAGAGFALDLISSGSRESVLLQIENNGNERELTRGKIKSKIEIGKSFSIVTRQSNMNREIHTPTLIKILEVSLEGAVFLAEDNIEYKVLW